MDAKKNKMCKVRLRRLRPDMVDKLKIKRGMSKADVQFSSSSSESEDDKMNVDDECEKISVQLKSPLALGGNKDFDPYVLLTEAQAALQLSSENDSKNTEEKMDAECSANNTSNKNISITTVSKPQKKPKHCKKQKSNCYPPLGENSANASSGKLKTSIENDIYDLIYYHSDDEGPCSYNCNHARSSSTAAVLALAPTDRRSSTGSSSSLLSDKCSMPFFKLFENNCISVMDDENPPTALSKILSIKEFDPLAPQQILAIIIKSIVSLAELSQRDDNIVCIDIDKRRIMEFSAMSPEEKRNCPLNPYMDVSNIVVTHSDDEFLTFCLCENCEKYREFVIHIMVEQFKATHMVVMLLDVLIKSYGPMLKNITAYNKFEKLLDSNKEIYWITCGVIYHKKAEHFDFIYDEYLSDNMIFVLFSSILMLNNPLLLLQILAFHVECIVEAYAEGFLEIVEPDKSKIPADEMINYILNGYDDLMRISEQVASYLFAFENDFLRKFSLTWKLLCQRLYQQHVHFHLADTMLACIITLKEEELTAHHTDLIKRYIQFDDIMNYVEKRWTDVWIELNKFNLSEVERKRRKSLLDVYRIFDTVVQDAIGFSLQDSVDDNDFYDFRFLKNRRLAWKNIMSYTKMKWPDGFFQPPNTLVIDDKCQTCNVSLDYHADYCKCITCSIAGGPLPPRRNADGKCSKCLAHEIVEKDVNFYDSKILNVCASDDFQNLVSKTSNNGAKRKNTALQEVGQELYSTLASVGEMLNVNDYETSSETASTNNSYHISWAVFNHLNNRKRYPHATIEEEYFCRDCKLPSCLLAHKILANKISPSLSQDLVHYYQPMSMSREELRSILPNIMLYNRKLVASNNGLDLIDVHDLVVKIYWIFIISIYAIYFINYDDNDEDDGNDKDASAVTGGGNHDDNVAGNTGDNEMQEHTKRKASYLDILELVNNDIKVNVDKITGNKDDTKFLEFLDKVKSLSPYNNDVESNFDVGVNVNSAEMQRKLNDILKINDNQDIPPQCDNIPPPIMTPTEDEEQPQTSDLTPSETVEAQPKKSCKEKTKKCCFDHSDMGTDHCKENHSSKKRLKKDCNHARMNETRDRLRKKLSQIVNARKNTKPLQSAETAQASTAASPTTTAATACAEAQNQMENVLNPEELKLFQQYLPQPDFWDIHDIVATFDHFHTEARRNNNLHNLCECLQHLKTNPKGAESKNNSNNNNSGSSSSSKKLQQQHTHQHVQQQEQLQPPPPPPPQQQQHENNPSPPQQSSSLEPPNKKSNLSNNSTRDASTSSQGTKNKDNNSTNNTTTPISSSKTANNLDFVSEICEIIDNYSKEQAKRKWIKETLSFIEGPTSGAGKKKTQPQTLNPKKAAKKAKQKQRKEEEKRITELQDLRSQFHNIYFKEFSEKLNLKSLKANKKRDKKKISELESNIKNLQRAKAKVETAILELIATVKQTNTEFKFPYLPTKEQQMEKVRELEGHDTSKEGDKTIKVRNLLHHTAKEAGDAMNYATTTTSTSSPFTMTPTNNLNMVPESYSMPYAHANHFPYNLGFPTPAAPAPFGLMRATPMCYAPPPTAAVASVQQQQQQQLAPDVVAAMAANTASNNTTDPSKRIVTIRRVNLPNVPEPQVTVTAKGPSPDKDKLLYTFINGQLIQTGTAPPITIPQMSAVTPLHHPPQPPTTQQSTHVTKLTAEHLLSIPPPPPPKLSKTQMKKERKRLAKLQAEKEAAEEAERKRIEEEQQRLRELREQKQLEMQQLQLEQQQQQKQKQPKKNKKNSQTQQQSKLSCCPPSLASNANNKEPSSNRKNKNKLSNSNSTTSVSTNEANDSPKLPQMMAIKNASKQKRSDSTTTSCSAATSTSSNNSTSSQMNTRDNSVSSLKPLDLQKNSSNNKKNTEKEQKTATNQKPNAANKNKTKTSQLKQQKQNKKTTRIPPTPSTTSSDAEDEDERQELDKPKAPTPPAPSKNQKQQTQATKSTKSSLNKQQNIPQKLKTNPKPITPPSSDSETEEEEEAVITAEPPIKEHKKRRPKLVDNGQFDNNPFKSLHMQDSETDWSSAEDDEANEDTENEVDVKMNKTSDIVQKTSVQKNEPKSKYTEEQSNNVKSNSTQNLKKKPETLNESKERKTPQPSTSSSTGNKNATSKSSKSNKNTKYQQSNEKLEQQITATKLNNPSRGQQRLQEVENKASKTVRPPKQTIQQNNGGVPNSRKGKNEHRQTNANSFMPQNKSNNKQPNASSSARNQQSTCSTSSRNNSNNNRNNNRNTSNLDQNQHNYQHYNHQPSSTTENRTSSNKRSQRNKKYQQKSQKHSSNSHHNHHQNCCSSGIPNHMGYFNANEVNITSSATSAHTQEPAHTNASQNRSYQALADQMQALRLSGHQVQSTTAAATAQQRQQHINSANVSIMDQLNRGVQVENLSLPPGITLTKVDPIKSEQLRQKSESIKKLAKPLQQQQHLHQQHNPQTFHHSASGATIIAPPVVNPMASYYGSPYINAASATAGIDPQSGIIMVEANPPKTQSNNRNNTMPQTNVANSNCNSKQSKNKKRRNKSKATNNNGSCSMASSVNSNQSENSGQPKMITLRNPMFHGGPTAAAAAMIHPPVLLPGRPADGFPMPAPLPVDQPAAIIKNENGMYTIRNPALHQAVTSGLAMGGYRQFGGNVNYYTPQEAAAEAARATRQQQQQHNENNNKSSTTSGNNPSSSSSFSYFSSDTVQTNTPHNNISISCTSIGGAELNHARAGTSVSGLIGDAAVIQRPTPQQRPISAIGSEIKNAQQQKQKTKVEQQWSNFGSDTLPLNKNDNLGCNTSFLSNVSEGGANTVVSGAAGSGVVAPVTDLSLQEKYQQSKYYNGFDVFTGTGSGGSSSSAATCAHMHHSCGDDSPPPSITGYNSYLEGIPNTGVIRYDDASFLKNLIPGQNLNNEVSIHNVNDSNFARNAQSPQAHRVEITPVYGNRPPSTNLYESTAGQANQTNFRGNYRDPLNDYKNDATTIFPSNNMHLNLNELENSMKYDFEQTPTTATNVAAVAGDNSHNTILDFKDLLIKNGPTGPASHRTSPYLDENTLEGFVQNMNSLQISNTSTEEPSSQLNGSGHCVGHGNTATTSANNPSNGWW
ncbi:uncharacterized protein LOC111677329 [Lucilia cuprina]|uniref:uncharacterized protein LOC111677329 n=1 Tax=Lucilia cuprina TaxID=7375 RepID=UPI001F057F39|nr:uncharacterized protein LOC111677329 [Lucilia cuprina]